jgi:hypothetical protein
MNSKKYIESFINDLERAHLQRFADDEDMKAVVKKVLLGGIYANGTLKAGQDPRPDFNCAFGYLGFADGNNVEKTDAQIGANVRALFEGIKSVKYGFEIIEDFKTPEEPKTVKKNPAI